MKIRLSEQSAELIRQADLAQTRYIRACRKMRLGVVYDAEPLEKLSLELEEALAAMKASWVVIP